MIQLNIWKTIYLNCGVIYNDIDWLLISQLLITKKKKTGKCKCSYVRLYFIWYHFILKLEIRAWNLYFLNENVLHLNNKNKPCFLTRIIDFLSPKVTALLFANSQIGAFAFAKISCSDKLAAMSNKPMKNKIRLRLVPRPARSYEEPPCFFISAWAVQSRKAADFLIVLQGK